MADGDIKIKDLSAALQIDDSAEFVYTQDNGGTNTTFKAPVNQIARKIAEGTTYTNLETTAKTLVGAINELSHLGNPIIVGTTAPTSSQGANGNIYIQYTAGTGGADDTVDGMFIKINGAWCEISTGGGGGSGGHTIVDNGGTSLTQRTNLQFNGAYSEDNSTDDTTEVNVVRSMTRAQFENLSAAEKVGLINITDESLNATELPISASDSTNTKDYIDTGLSWKQDNLIVQTITPTIDTSNVSSGAIVECYKYGRNVIVNIVSLSSKVAYSNNNSYKLASGLPIPLSSYQRGTVTEVDTQKSYRVAIDSNGDLYAWYQSIPINSNMCGTFNYISAT